MILNIPVT